MNQPETWEACPSGEINRMVERAKSTRKSAFVNSFAIAGCLVLTTCAAALYLQWSSSNPPGGIACEVVQPLLPEYQAETLEPEVQHQVAEHLLGCEHCRAKYQAMQAEVSEHEFTEGAASALAGVFR